MTKFNFALLCFGVLALPQALLGLGVPGNMDSNYTYSNVQLTGYSAACRYDRFGGRNQSSADRRLKPRAHTLDGTQVADNVVVTAVPQIGGMASLYRCFYKIIPPPHAPADIKAKMSRKIFFAGDHYGVGSNHRKKIDVSYGCSRSVQNRTYRGAKIKRLNCVPRNANILTAINDMSFANTAFADAGPSASLSGMSSSPIMSDAGAGR